MEQWAADCRLRAGQALAAGDGHAAHGAAKAWVTHGGGSRLPAPWLVHAAGALLQRQPRGAVHALDLGLEHWVEAPPDRSVLLWARGSVVLRHLRDPKTALADFRAAAVDAPEWLRERLGADLAESGTAASVSRKRKPAVELAPVYLGSTAVVADSPGPSHRAGVEPELWAAVEPLLAGRERP